MSKLLGKPPWRGVAWLSVLGPVFFLSYGYANHRTAQLADVPAFVFAWEVDAIPFLPWLIIPYMSIDLFYAGSLFLIRASDELDTHASRLLLATTVAVICFFIFPLQCTLVRPPVDGVNGWLLQILSGFDQPFNQSPSLHISLLILLWPKYAARLTGLSRLALHLWFSLIGISVLCTWQHRVIDVVWGMVAGVLVWYVLPMPLLRMSWRAPAMLPIAVWHGAGALVSALLAFAGGGLMLLMLWPALSLAILSLAYCGAGATVFQKDADGQLSLPASLVLLPYRWSARLVRRAYRSPPITAVIDELTLCAWPGPTHPGAAVLDLCGEYSLGGTFGCYRSVPLLDRSVPQVTDLTAIVTAIEDMLPHGPVWVFCAMGRGRSALVAAAWLLHRRRVNGVADAMSAVRERGFGVVFPVGTAMLLEAWVNTAH